MHISIFEGKVPDRAAIAVFRYDHVLLTIFAECIAVVSVLDHPVRASINSHITTPRSCRWRQYSLANMER